MIGFLYVLAAIAAFAVIATVVYQLRLARHRGVSREAFIREFRSLSVPETVSAAVYDYYKSSAISRQFTVSPDDSYAKLFSDLPDDIEFDAKQLVQRLGMKLPPESVLRTWGRPFATLRDMVLWLDWVRQHQ